MKAIPPIATHVTVAWSVRLSVCMSSVTIVHPAKAVGNGRNEMPLGRDTRVAPGNTALDRGAGLTRERGIMA